MEHGERWGELSAPPFFCGGAAILRSAALLIPQAGTCGRTAAVVRHARLGAGVPRSCEAQPSDVRLHSDR